MKTKPPLRSFLALSGSALLAITTAHADTLYWDGATPADDPTGGSGTWDTSTQNWDTALTGGSASAWTSGDFAVFGTPAGTVTVGSGITTSGMQFNVHSYIIDASSNAFTFASGNNTISTNFTSVSGNITSINGTVAGTGANLLFSAVNAPAVLPVGHMISFGGASAGGWTGTTTIEKNMIVRLQDTNQALLNTSGITLQGGLIVLKSSADQATLDRVKDSAAINSYGGSIRAAHENLVSNTAYSESMGNLTLYGGNTVLLHDTRLNFNGTSGMSGELIFSNITQAEGSYATLYAGARDNLQSTSLTGYKIRNTGFGGSATAANEIIGPWLTVGNNTSGSDYGRYDASGNIINAAYSGTNNGNVEANLTTSWASTANFNWNASANANAIDLVNDVTLNTLRMQNANAINLGDFVFATNGISINGATTIQTAGSGYLTAAGNSGSGNAIYLSAGNNNLTLTAPIRDNGNPVAVVLTTGINNNSVNLNGANEHTGGTIITAVGVRLGDGQGGTTGGRVELNNISGLGANTNRLSVQSGVLDLNSISATVGKFDGYTAGTVTGNSTAVLTVGQGTTVSDTSDFAGSIIGTGVGFTKTGAGTQILSGVNVSTGATLVSAGTLLVNGSLGASAVTVNSGAFGGSGSIGSTLDLVAGSFHVVDLLDALQVTGTVTLYAGFGIDDLAGLTWGSVADGTYTLINGTLGTGVFDSLANNSLGTAYDIGGGRSAYFQEGSLQLVIVPEPRAALLGGLGTLLLLRRRRA